MIASTVIVNLMTLAGVSLIGVKMMGGVEITPTVKGSIEGFASGSLMACAVFLILVEAMHLINSKEWTEHEEDQEKETVWRWGTALLGGFVIAPVLFVLNPLTFCATALGNPSEPVDQKEAEMSDLDTPVPTSTLSKEVLGNRKVTTLFAICMGDFLHNLVDGFAIGFAFKMCDTAVAWGILGATVYHEIAQEIGDFGLLTLDVGLSVPKALLWNFLAGTSVIWGGLMAVGMDISDSDTGVLLAIGGGNYVYLAAVEALPRAFQESENLEDQSSQSVKKHYASVLASWFLGCFLIGITLIEHKHCEPEGADPHAH